jgi:hypothetical protein
MKAALFLPSMAAACAFLLLLLSLWLQSRRCYIVTYSLPHVSGSVRHEMRIYSKNRFSAWLTLCRFSWSKDALIHSIR